MRGILASWAVPNGPPLEAGKRRLAVHTEDHPLEYLTFHGVIPDGYGAGSMTIWDTGTYELIEEKPNELKIRMKGTRLDGEWVIVQTRQNEGRDWLMIKHGTPPKSDPLLSKIVPMLASAADEPFDSPDFTYEPKWDGARTIAFVEGGEVRLQTRNRLDCTKQYPEATQAAEALTGAYHAILDGEIVALDSKGVPSFQRLQPRMHVSDESTVRKLRKSTPVIYQVFDILYADGEDLTRKPLRERLRRLDEALTPMGSIRRSEGFPGTGIALFEAAREQGIEGIVAKRLDSIYQPGATGEERSESAKKAQDAAKRAATAPAPSLNGGQAARVPSVLEVEGKRIKLTNLEKVLFPEDGYTKADLIRYYTEVSPYLVPWLRDRPLTLKPFPDGIHGTHFYQKNKPGFTPEWIKSWTDPREPENAYVLANDMATLVWMANYTAIEIHPRLARADDPEKPDNVMVDLDPAEGATWDDVKEVAHVVKAVLDDLGIVGFPKTTGSRGIHVLVPIARRYTFEESRAFALRVGQLARERLPKLVTLEFSKSKRRGIYIDYLQNTRAKSTAGPYSVRPIRRAPVSAPLRWDEIASLGRPDAFTMINMSARLEAVGDLLGPSLGLAQKLPKPSA